MSVSRPLLLGLGGLALLGVVQWVILPAFEYRADNASRAERARQRHPVSYTHLTLPTT